MERNSRAKKTSSIRLSVSIELRLVTNTDRQTYKHSLVGLPALAYRRAGKNCRLETNLVSRLSQLR